MLRTGSVAHFLGKRISEADQATDLKIPRNRLISSRHAKEKATRTISAGDVWV
jgi:hypothetical protein